MPYSSRRLAMRIGYLPRSVLPLLVLALLAHGACVPHTHVGVGLFNADHDLTLFATTRTVGSLPVAALLFVSLATAPQAIWLPSAPTGRSPRDADSRAPPVA